MPEWLVGPEGESDSSMKDDKALQKNKMYALHCIYCQRKRSLFVLYSSEYAVLSVLFTPITTQ